MERERDVHHGPFPPRFSGLPAKVRPKREAFRFCVVVVELARHICFWPYLRAWEVVLGVYLLARKMRAPFGYVNAIST